jgi:pyruvate kinase
VRSQLHEEPQDTTDLIDVCARCARGMGIDAGERIGITAGLPAGESGGTNLFKVHVVE